MVKLKWRVSEPPTGRYRSFQNRAWPSAEWPNGSSAAHIHCSDEYTPACAREEAPHAPLEVWVACYRPESGFDNRRLKARQLTLTAAKELVDKFFSANPDSRPVDYRQSKEGI